MTSKLVNSGNNVKLHGCSLIPDMRRDQENQSQMLFSSDDTIVSLTLQPLGCCADRACSSRLMELSCGPVCRVTSLTQAGESSNWEGPREL